MLLKAIKFKTAPTLTYDSPDGEWIGGDEEVIVAIHAIAGFFPASDGPNGMNRTEILLINGHYRYGIGSVEDFAKYAILVTPRRN